MGAGTWPCGIGSRLEHLGGHEVDLGVVCGLDTALDPQHLPDRVLIPVPDLKVLPRLPERERHLWAVGHLAFRQQCGRLRLFTCPPESHNLYSDTTSINRGRHFYRSTLGEHAFRKGTILLSCVLIPSSIPYSSSPGAQNADPTGPCINTHMQKKKKKQNKCCWKLGAKVQCFSTAALQTGILKPYENTSHEAGHRLDGTPVHLKEKHTDSDL